MSKSHVQQTVDDDRIGTVLSQKYVLEAIVGTGASATVYRAIQQPVGRAVAVKVIHKEMNDRARARFLDEARVLAQLQHASLVTLFDYGVSEDGTAYMVMELVEGRSLAELIDQLSIGSWTAIAGQVLDALEVAHDHGVIHRDLKPEHVLLVVDEQGRWRAKLVDFGVAKVIHGEGSRRSTMLTGTPQFMAPEQAQGEAIDGRADLYALGVILHRGLSGALPFSGSHTIATLYKHLQAPIPPLPSTTPDAVAAIIHRALQKDPEDRFPSAAAMRFALSAALAGERSDTVPHDEGLVLESLLELPTPRIAPTLPWRSVAVSALGALLAVGFWWGLQSPARAPTTRDHGLAPTVVEPAPSPGAASEEREPVEAQAKAPPAADSDPSEPSPPTVSSYEKLIVRARVLLENGRSRQAGELYRQAVEAHGNRPEARTGVGWVHVAQGRIGAGLKEFEQVARAHPRYAAVYIGLGKGYRKLGRWTAARAAYERYLEIHPRGPSVSIARAALERLAEPKG